MPVDFEPSRIVIVPISVGRRPCVSAMNCIDDAGLMSADVTNARLSHDASCCGDDRAMHRALERRGRRAGIARCP